jgi:hypothetical protein
MLAGYVFFFGEERRRREQMKLHAVGPHDLRVHDTDGVRQGGDRDGAATGSGPWSPMGWPRRHDAAWQNSL